MADLQSMNPQTREQLQKRINLALSERPGDKTRFSPYTSAAWVPLTEKLVKSQRGQGLTRIQAVLDEFDRFERSCDRALLRYALMNFLIKHADLAGLGLRIPSLEERFGP